MTWRVGIGVDAHRFASERPLVLGGIELSATGGLEAHSDGDVLSHAILDALFGAANLGDKGRFFPPSDPQYRNIRSTELLRRAASLLREHGWEVGNVDASVVCEIPRISPHAQLMTTAIAQALDISPDKISVKGTTSEGLGFTGRKEGIAAMAVVLLQYVKD